MYEFAISFIAALAIIILWSSIGKLVVRRSGNYKAKTSLPPGPRGLPILGFLPFLRQDMHHQFTELAQKYGPIYKLWVGSKLFVVISSPSLIKEVVRDHDTIFSNRNITVAARIATYNLNDIAWSRYGPQWRNLRKLFAREMLSKANLDTSYNLRRDGVRKAVREVYSRKGTPIDVFDLVFRSDLDVMINLIWGGKLEVARRDRIHAELLPVVAQILDRLVKPNVSDFFPLLAKFDLQGIAKEMTSLVQRVEKITVEAIDERIERHYNNSDAAELDKQGRKDFLQILVDLMMDEENKKTSSFGRSQIKAMLIDILVGGTDTSSTTIEWVMAELLNHPRVMAKVLEELDQVVGRDNIVEEFHISKLEYLDAVLKETVRIRPVGPFLTPRTPSETCTIGGYTVPKDSAIFVNAWSVHRDPLFWGENANEFWPERFLHSGEEGRKVDFLGHNFSYIPFGSGRRICAGLPLAERMVRHVLASLLHAFEWRLPDGGEKLDMSDKLMTSLKKRVPLRAVPTPRLSRADLYE